MALPQTAPSNARIAACEVEQQLVLLLVLLRNQAIVAVLSGDRVDHMGTRDTGELRGQSGDDVYSRLHDADRAGILPSWRRAAASGRLRKSSLAEAFAVHLQRLVRCSQLRRRVKALRQTHHRCPGVLRIRGRLQAECAADHPISGDPRYTSVARMQVRPEEERYVTYGEDII